MTDKQIFLTDAAARRIESFLQHEGGAGLRLGVRRTGCSGWAYVVDLADEVGENDEIFEDRGIRILVDRDALPLLTGTKIDFVQQGLNATFEFSNPNVTDECGCGESFAVATSA